MAAPVITVIKAERIMEVFHRRREAQGGLWKAPRRGNRAPRPARTGSVDVRNETPGAGPIGVVFGAESLAEQPLLRLDASEQDNEHHDGDNHADAGAERQRPAEHGDKEAERARVADDPIEAVGDQPMFGLDRDEAAEAPPQHEDRRETKDASG